MIRLLIANGQPIVREGLKQLVIRWRNIELVGMAADGNGTLELVQVTPADVLLLDTSMRGRGFLDILQRLRAAQPGLQILVFSGNAKVAFAARVLKAGASGYLTKYSTAEELAEAIGRVHSGHKYVSPALGDVVAHLMASPAETPDHARLTDREYEVLCLLGAGKRNTAIAPELGLSSKTVSTYRTRLLRKLSLTTSAELIRYAIEHELVPEMHRN